MTNQAADRGAGATGPGDLVTASALKLAAAKILAGNSAGKLIGAVTGKRIRHHGLWFDTRSEIFSPRVRAQMFWGIYESAETRAIAALLCGSRTVIELGSSLGVTSAHIAAQLGPDGRLICVEANPHLVAGLRERVTQHRRSATVDVLHAAIAGHCGEAFLRLGKQTTGSRLAVDSRPGVAVPTLTLRELVRRTGVTDFDLVADIEGAEVAFLQLDPGALDRCGRIVIELHDTNAAGRPVSVADLLDAAQAAGFSVVSRRGPVVGLSRL
ncbi:MAG: FkbM family methyltransferase [Streptosporangiaceae bacterium]